MLKGAQHHAVRRARGSRHARRDGAHPSRRNVRSGLRTLRCGLPEIDICFFPSSSPIAGSRAFLLTKADISSRHHLARFWDIIVASAAVFLTAVPPCPPPTHCMHTSHLLSIALVECANLFPERILLILTRCVRLSSEKSACAKVRPVRPVRKCEQRAEVRTEARARAKVRPVRKCESAKRGKGKGESVRSVKRG